MKKETPHSNILKIDETGFFFKVTFLKKKTLHQGSNAAKDRITRLVGSNTSGDLKVKPLAVYHVETPRAMKVYPKPHLPVIWRSNKKGWITGTVFQDWFTSCFFTAIRLRTLKIKPCLSLIMPRPSN